MVTIQCFSWAVYGWIRDDWSTFINNAVGVVLGSIQLTLIALYGNKRAGAAHHGNGSGPTLPVAKVADSSSAGAEGGGGGEAPSGSSGACTTTLPPPAARGALSARAAQHALARPPRDLRDLAMEASREDYLLN